MQRMFPLFLLFMVCGLEAYAQAPYSISISLPDPAKTVFTVGEAIQCNLQIENHSTNTIQAVRPLDGSSDGMRYPIYDMQVEKPARIPNLPQYLRCGNTNNITASDFVTLAPGERLAIDSGWLKTFTPVMAGTYRISYAVKFDAEKKQYEGFMGLFEWTEELTKLYDAIPKFDAVSNTIEIHVKSNGETGDLNYHSLFGMSENEVKRLYFPYNDVLPTNNNICELPCWEIGVRCHFDENEKIDGVEITSKEPGNVSLHEDMLHWARGDIKLLPEDVVRGRDSIQSIRVGWFADASIRDAARYEPLHRSQ